MNTLRQFIVFFFTFLATFSAYSADFQKQLIHEYNATDIEKLRIESDAGDIKIQKSQSGRIDVTVTMKARTGSQAKADQIFANAKVEFTQPGTTGRVVVKNNKSGWDWLKFWKKFPSVGILISIPDGLELDIASGAGEVDGQSFAANVKLATGAGDVVLNGMKGSLSIATGAGDVQIRRFDGSLNAATGAGDFDADGSFSSFDISTGAGDVQLLVDNPVSSKSSISTGAGDIQVSLPVGSSFNLGADVGFGEISCAFDIVDTNPDKKAFRGVYNEGSVNIRLSTGFGDIVVGRR